MDEQIEQIAPCPFCGAEAKVGTTFFGLQDQVKCGGCGVMLWKERTEAIAAWNTRAALAPPRHD